MMENPIWLMSSAYDRLSQDQLIEKAKHLGVQGIDLCVFRNDTDRADHVATHLDYNNFDVNVAREMLDRFNREQLRLSVGAFDNIIGGDESERIKNQNHLLKLIRIAHLLGGDENDVLVGTFVGYNHKLGNEIDGFQKNLDEYQRVFTPIIQYASDLGVTIVYENCPMEGWRSSRYTSTFNNLSGVLAARKLMYAMIDSSAHGEIYDPSHDIWQNIDPVEVIRASNIDKIKRIHVKTTRMLHGRARIDWGGMYPMQYVDKALADKADISIPRNDWDRHHYEAMLPGFGGSDDMDWNGFVEELHHREFSGPFEIENEAKNSKETAVEAAIDQGTSAAVHFLSPLLWNVRSEGYTPPSFVELKELSRNDVPVRTMKDLTNR